MERRRHARLTQPLEGRFRAPWGSFPCRISDISWGGCFVDAVNTPPAGQPTVVTVRIGDSSIDIVGRVLNVEQKLGFSVKFSQLTAGHVAVLSTLLGKPPVRVQKSVDAAEAEVATGSGTSR